MALIKVHWGEFTGWDRVHNVDHLSKEKLRVKPHRLTILIIYILWWPPKNEYFFYFWSLMKKYVNLARFENAHQKSARSENFKRSLKIFKNFQNGRKWNFFFRHVIIAYVENYKYSENFKSIYQFIEVVHDFLIFKLVYFRCFRVACKYKY